MALSAGIVTGGHEALGFPGSAAVSDLTMMLARKKVWGPDALILYISRDSVDTPCRIPNSTTESA
jgi:hypothetical protein